MSKQAISRLLRTYRTELNITTDSTEGMRQKRATIIRFIAVLEALLEE